MDFNKVIQEQIKRCYAVLDKKGAEYGPDDRLSNFKKAAILQNTTNRGALFGMLSKHLVSLSDMCSDNKDYSIDVWNEKITDSINYLLLLRAVIAEDNNEEY